MIIHIAGPSGSGKSTLAKKIKNTHKWLTVIDTDDIDDYNSLKILNKYNLNTAANQKAYSIATAKLNKQHINELVEENENILFVGFFHKGMDHMVNLVDHGFTIAIDPETLWRQYNDRTISLLHKHSNAIKKLLNSKIDPMKIRKIFSKKFGIRNGFDSAGIDDMEKAIKSMKRRAREQKYQYDTSNNIYKKIVSLLKMNSKTN